MQKTKTKKLDIKFVKDDVRGSDGYYVIRDRGDNDMALYLRKYDDGKCWVHADADSTDRYYCEVFTSFEEAIEKVAGILDVNKELIFAQYAVQGG